MTTQPPASLSSAEPADLTDYRPVSPVAVMGCLLAVVSALALVTPWLAFLPPLAAFVSWWGYRDVRRSADSKSGATVGVIGVTIALAVFAAGAARSTIADSLHREDAAAVVDVFLERLSEGDFVGAHQLTLPFTERRPNAGDPEAYYAGNDEAGKELGVFSSLPLIERLASGETPRRLRQGPVVRLRGGALRSEWLYELPGSGVNAAQRFVLRVQRSRPTLAADAAWRVESAEPARD